MEIAHTIYTLEFYKTNDVHFVSYVHQYIKRCSEFNNIPTNYTIYCGSGTHDESAATKNYTLKIQRVDATDLSYWWCSLGKIYSTKITLELKSKSLFPFTYILNFLNTAGEIACRRL